MFRQSPRTQRSFKSIGKAGMKVADFLKIMGVITVMAVLYIHLQMEIYTLAYQGKTKQMQIEKLSEKNVFVSNDILRLKSSDHIGRELLMKEKDYSFASRKHVVEVESRGQDWLGPMAQKVVAPSEKIVTLAFSQGKRLAGK
jgi:cell division protein FtsL